MRRVLGKADGLLVVVIVGLEVSAGGQQEFGNVIRGSGIDPWVAGDTKISPLFRVPQISHWMYAFLPVLEFSRLPQSVQNTSEPMAAMTIAHVLSPSNLWVAILPVHGFLLL